MKSKFTHTFTLTNIELCFMENYAHAPKRKNLTLWGIENIKAKFRTSVFVVNDGIAVSVKLLDLKFDYTLAKYKRMDDGYQHIIRPTQKRTYKFNLLNYKEAIHNHDYPSPHTQFRKTDNKIITIYPNTITVFAKTLNNICIKPKTLLLYLSSNHNRIEIQY